MTQQRLQNPLYLNWIRGALGLQYLKDGLYGFVDAYSKKQHEQLIDAIRQSSSYAPSACHQCTLGNLLPEHAGLKICLQRTKAKCLCKSPSGRRKCPNGICSRMYDLIVDGHYHREPLWQNTDPHLWFTDYWSIARCFLASLCHTISAKDTDASGLLSIILNNVFLQKELAVAKTSVTDLFSRARETRNEILHSSTLELEDEQMKTYLDTFIDVLQNKKIFMHAVSAQNAIRNISQLKDCQLYISLKDELQIRREALQAIEEKRTEALQQIESAQTKAIEALQSVKDRADKSTRVTSEGDKEKLSVFSSQLTKIETSLKIKHKRVRHLEDRMEKSEGLHRQLEEKIDSIQEEIHQQIETIKSHQTVQEQMLSELMSQLMTLKQEVEALKTSLADTYQLRDVHTKCIEKLELKADLQTELVTLYQQYYLKTDVSPLLPEEDVDVDSVFVSLVMERLCNRDESTRRRGEPIYFFEDMFFRGESSFRNIFLTADAGVGKTTLCRKLTSIWCKVHSGQYHSILEGNIQTSRFRTKENIELKDRQTMKTFTYLFYVSLRHTNNEKTIEEMICSQLLTERKKDLLIEILEEQPGRCLVVLDGLDEWNDPTCRLKSPFITSGLPNKEVKKPYITLYTTRPWKLEKIRPKTGEVDVEIKLLGINSSEAKTLARTVIEKLNESSHHVLNADDFIASLESKELRSLISIPILLKLLVCLWHEEQNFGASLCGLYSSVIELLLRVAIERNSNDEQFMNTLTKLEKSTKETLPACFNDKSNCNSLTVLLNVLARLGFKSLFESEQKSSLVFEGLDLTKFWLSQEEMNFCLKAGLLSQRLLLGKSSINRCKSVTFMHKTFQEFFAAIHIAISERNEVLHTVFNVCYSVEKVLEMGKVIQFIGGLSPPSLYKISEHIMALTDEDGRFKLYRSIDSSRIFILMIQDLLFQSIKESLDCGHVSLPEFKLRDVHVWDENTNDYVLYVDPVSVRSLSSNSCITKAIKDCVSKTNSLQLFCLSGLFGEFPKDFFFEILKNSSNTLICINVKSANIEPPKGTPFAKLQMLSKIMLSDVTLNHSTMKCLLSDSPHLRECVAFCTHCVKDENCGCGVTSYEAIITNAVSTPIRRFECRYSRQLFRHIGTAENLEELNVANWKEHEVSDISRIIKTSKSLEKVVLKDIEPEFLTFPLPEYLTTLRCIHVSEIKISMGAVLTLLTNTECTEKSFTVEFVDVKLTRGHIDELTDKIRRAEIFQINALKKRWKRRGNFRRTMYCSSPGANLEAVFSMALSKLN